MNKIDREIMELALWALEGPLVGTDQRLRRAAIWNLRNRLAQKKRIITRRNSVETNATTLGDLNDAQRSAA